MRVPVRCAIAGVTLMWSAVAVADPSPSTSMVPEYIDLVGTRAGVPDPEGEFGIVVRDAASAPIAGATVRLLFGGCPDLRPSAVQPYPGLIVSCGGSTVTAVTDAQGVARFIVLGSIVRRAPISAEGCVEVRADPGNVLLGTTSAAAFDQDGIDGVTSNDVSLAVCDQLQGNGSRPRSNFSHTGSVLANLSEMQQRYEAGTSAETGARCDGRPIVSPAIEAGDFRLSWSECRGGGGTEALSFACNTNSGSLPPVICSVVAPPGVTSLRALEAVVDIIGERGSPLPPWWQFQQGDCRSGRLGVGAAGETACAEALPFASASTRIEDVPGEPNVARVRITVAPQEPTALEGGIEYNLFRLLISRASTVQEILGPPPCEGCTSPVTLKLRSVRLIQAGGCDEPADPLDPPFTHFVMGPPTTLTHVIAQGRVTGVEEPGASLDLALRPLGKVPSSGGVQIAFTLPEAGSAWIEVVDVAGRQVVVRSLAGLAAGRHALEVAEAGALRAGFYLVQLRQGRVSASLKWLVLP